MRSQSPIHYEVDNLSLRILVFRSVGLWLTRLIPHIAQFEELLVVENAKGLAVHYKKSRRNLLLVICGVVQTVIELIADLAYEHILCIQVVRKRLVLVVLLTVLPISKKQVSTRGLVRQNILTSVHEALRIFLEFMCHVQILHLRRLTDVSRVRVLAWHSTRYFARHR